MLSFKLSLSRFQFRLDEKGEWPAPFNVGGQPCLVILTPEGSKKLARWVDLQVDDLRAFNAVCTHTDCTVQFEPRENRTFCACDERAHQIPSSQKLTYVR